MAENEILDLNSRRWQRTRAALARSDLSLAAMAERTADNFQSVLQLSLASAFRKGQTLLMIFEAVDQHDSAMRAAVSMFQDQHLARIARDAAKAAATQDIPSIARCAVDMLVDGLIKKAVLLANGNGCFQESDRREALKIALEREFSIRRSSLAGVIEASLHGKPVRQYRAAKQSRMPMTPSAAVRLPLAILKRGGNHVPGPH